MGRYSQYDAILFGIAIALIAILIGMAFSMELVAIAGVCSLLLLGYGLFGNPPVNRNL